MSMRRLNLIALRNVIEERLLLFRRVIIREVFNVVLHVN